MATCDIQVNSIANALVNWEPYGEIQGFADGELSVEIATSDESANTMKVSSDGLSGTISGNNKTNGTVTLKLQPGSIHVGQLTDIFHRNKFTRGTMTVADVETGETWELQCTVMENLPPMGRGSEVPDSYDFPFLYRQSVYTPSQITIQRQGQDAE